MAIPKIGETISQEQFNTIPRIGETISPEQFDTIPEQSLQGTLSQPEQPFFSPAPEVRTRDFLREGVGAVGGALDFLKKKRIKAIEEIDVIERKEDKGQINKVAEFVGKAGVGAEAIASTAFEAVLQGIKGINSLAEKISGTEGTGDIIVDKAINAGADFLKTETGKSVLEIAEAGEQVWKQFEKESPSLAETTKGLAKISELIPAGKVAKEVGIIGKEVGKVGKVVAGEVSLAGKLALGEAGDIAEKGVKKVGEAVGDVVETGREVIEGRLKKQISKENLDIVQPKPKTLSTKERLKRLEAGEGETTTITGEIKLKPSKADINIAESVNDVVSKDKDVFDNIKAINKKIEEKSVNIEDKLKGLDWEFDRDLISPELDDLKNQSKVIFAGEKALENSYDAVTNEMKKIFADKPNTLDGLLDTRKEFDAVIKRKFPNIFDKMGGDIIKSNAVMDVRNSVNNFIIKKAPERVVGVGIRKELIDTTNMYRARKNIARNILGDLDTTRLQRATKKLTGGLTGAAVLTSGLSIGSFMGIISSPVALSAVLAGGSYKVGKSVITSKKLKEGLIKVLSIGKKIDETEVKVIKDTIKLLEAPTTIITPVPKQADTSFAKLVQAKKGLVGRDPKTGRFFGTFTSEPMLKPEDYVSDNLSRFNKPLLDIPKQKVGDKPISELGNKLPSNLFFKEKKSQTIEQANNKVKKILELSESKAKKDKSRIESQEKLIKDLEKELKKQPKLPSSLKYKKK